MSHSGLSVSQLDQNKKERTMPAVIRALIGAVFGIISAVVLSPALAAFLQQTDKNAAIAIWAIAAIMAALGFFAPTIRRAFGRGFLMLGVCFLALPISTLLLTGRVTHELITSAPENDPAAAVIGAGLAGMAATGIATFVGLIAGAIFVIIGLVLALGGQREVIVIDRYRGSASRDYYQPDSRNNTDPSARRSNEPPLRRSEGPSERRKIVAPVRR
ncbi:hypothetical protein IQ24_04006 [Paracoccus sulfuroxidans]|uniref:Uncharacterized protein n=2 Tax=Paracoccus sulfuroxidans TaxID=384678 RepID=A0A562N419_9RHOB|nr:hypothetical protein IQ24_04006 [Paracoccus sulfuroxidans]